MNYNLSEVLSIISDIFPVIAAAYNYGDLDKILKLLALFFLISFLFDIAGVIMRIYHVHNNMPSIHLFIIITIVFLGTVYYMSFFDSVFKRITLVLSAITLSITLWYALNIWVYPSESNTLSGISFIILALLYFYQLLNRQEFIHIEKQGFFWINAGILFYFSINLFLFMLFRKIISQHLGEYYIIHSITNIIANLLYSVGLLCKPQTAA